MNSNNKLIQMPIHQIVIQNKILNCHGDFSKWRSFIDSFTALIHENKMLSEVQKLCYLRSSLSGDALNTIQSLETTEINYKIALDIIKEKFSSTRRIVYSHVQAVLNLKYNKLKTFTNTIEQNLCCLNTFDINTEAWEAILVPLFLSKLERNVEQEWNIHINSLISKNTLPTCKQLINFLNERSDVFDSTSHYKQNATKPKLHVLTSSVSNESNCIVCTKNHPLYRCSKFLSKSIRERIQIVKNAKNCFNCLNSGHFNTTCKASKCRTCGLNHSTLLHINKEPSNQFETDTQSIQSTSKDNIVNCVSAFASKFETLLATAEVFISGNDGKLHKARALLDLAATSNFVTENLVQRLQLKTHKYEFNINAFNKKSSTLNACKYFVSNKGLQF